MRFINKSSTKRPHIPPQRYALTALLSKFLVHFFYVKVTICEFLSNIVAIREIHAGQNILSVCIKRERAGIWHALTVIVDSKYITVSDDALFHHGCGHLHEAGDIGALHIVEVTVGLLAVSHTLLMDGSHDLMQFGIDLLGSPLEVLGILGHFKTGACHTAGVDSLAGSIVELVLDEAVDGLGGASHVGYLGHKLHAVGYDLLGILA